MPEAPDAAPEEGPSPKALQPPSAAIPILNKAIAQMETMIENVPGLLSRKFEVYRTWIKERLCGLGYETRIELLNAADFGVPQHWLRVFIIGLKPQYVPFFRPVNVQLSGKKLLGWLPPRRWAGRRQQQTRA